MTEAPHATSFAEALQLARARCGVTVDDLAWRMGVSQSTVRAWLYRGATPTIANLLRLCRELDSSPDELLAWTATGACQKKDQGPRSD